METLCGFDSGAWDFKGGTEDVGFGDGGSLECLGIGGVGCLAEIVVLGCHCHGMETKLGLQKGRNIGCCSERGWFVLGLRGRVSSLDPLLV